MMAHGMDFNSFMDVEATVEAAGSALERILRLRSRPAGIAVGRGVSPWRTFAGRATSASAESQPPCRADSACWRRDEGMHALRSYILPVCLLRAGADQPPRPPRALHRDSLGRLRAVVVCCVRVAPQLQPRLLSTCCTCHMFETMSMCVGCGAGLCGPVLCAVCCVDWAKAKENRK